MSCQERLPAVKTGLHRCVGGWDSVPYVAGEPCSATQTQLVLGEGKEAEKDIGQKLASSRLLFGALFLGFPCNVSVIAFYFLVSIMCLSAYNVFLCFNAPYIKRYK